MAWWILVIPLFEHGIHIHIFAKKNGIEFCFPLFVSIHFIHPLEFVLGSSLRIVTGRNEVVAKVIFLHLFVILFTGGGSASVHAGIPPPPPREQTLLPSRSRPPRGSRPLPPGKQTPAYGLRAAGTHPTGKQSFYLYFFSIPSWSIPANKAPIYSVCFLPSIQIHDLIHDRSKRKQ